MDAVDSLIAEHRLIEEVCDALVAFADEVRRRDADDRPELARFVHFLASFADGCHHGKEEDVLFDAMVDAGFPERGGPIAVMLAEHDEGRRHLAALEALAGQRPAWSSDDRRRLQESAFAYALLLRHHIQKEDQILYPMAEQHLSAEAVARVDRECAARDEEQVRSGEQERLAALARELIALHAGALHPGAAGLVR